MIRTIDELVRDINKMHESRFRFNANIYHVADSRQRFGELIGIVARDLKSNAAFYRSAVELVSELSQFSLDFPGQNVIMSYAIGPNGVVVKYMDDNMLPSRFPLMDEADERVYDEEKKIVAYAKFGLLNVAFPDEHRTRRFALTK